MQEMLLGLWRDMPPAPVFAHFGLLLLMMAAAGLPLMAIVGENLALSRQRASWNKCARQLAACGLCVGLVPLAALGGLLLHAVFTRQPDLLAQWPDITPATFTLMEQGGIIVWLSLFMGMFFLALYAVLWQSLRGSPVLHQILGLLAMLLNTEALYGRLCLLGAHDSVLPPPRSLTELFLPVPEAEVWNLVPYALPLCLAFAGAFGTLWLVARRNRDDYGRDHYRQMVPWCGAWARNGWLLSWLLVVGFVGVNLWYVRFETGYLPLRDLLGAAGQMAIWCIPFLLWLIVCRSEAPLRHKLTMLLGFVLMGVCAALLFAAFLPEALLL